MSWDCLSAEIACMFADYTWRTDERDAAIETRVADLRERERERQRDPLVRLRKRQWQKRNPEKMAAYRNKWRAMNLERAREQNRRSVARQKARDPEGYRARKRERARLFRETHRDRLRAEWRARWHRCKGAPVIEQHCGVCGESGHNRRSCPRIEH